MASKYRGGGHPQASGAKLNNKDEIDLLINDLNELIKWKYKNI